MGKWNEQRNNCSTHNVWLLCHRRSISHVLGDSMKKCVMCKEDFEEDKLDFLDRCEPCFRKYLFMEDKPHVGVPFVPIYNGGK
jgi:DNA-directed RNA polymerase subunit RPC12/RpoP